VVDEEDFRTDKEEQDDEHETTVTLYGLANIIGSTVVNPLESRDEVLTALMQAPASPEEKQMDEAKTTFYNQLLNCWLG
jgi:hypothetical protein